MRLTTIRLLLIYAVAMLLSPFFGSSAVSFAKGGGGGGKKGDYGTPGEMPKPVEPDAVKPLSEEEKAAQEAAKKKEEQDAERRRLYGGAGTILTGSLGVDEEDNFANPAPRKRLI